MAFNEELIESKYKCRIFKSLDVKKVENKLYRYDQIRHFKDINFNWISLLEYV